MRRFCLPLYLLLGASGLLAGCSSDSSSGPEVLNAQPDGITLRDNRNDMEVAGITADEHCAKYGKVAHLLSQRQPKGIASFEYAGTAEFVFACVYPGAEGPSATGQ